LKEGEKEFDGIRAKQENGVRRRRRRSCWLEKSQIRSEQNHGRYRYR